MNDVSSIAHNTADGAKKSEGFWLILSWNTAHTSPSLITASFGQNYGDLSLFGTKKNGTYTGVLGKIVANEGDVFLLPSPVLSLKESLKSVLLSRLQELQ